MARHVRGQQVREHVRPERVAREEERPPAVVVRDVVVEGSDPVLRRGAGHDRVLLRLRECGARRGVRLPVVGRVDVRDRSERGDLAGGRHPVARHHAGVVDRADDRVARRRALVLRRREIEDVHRLVDRRGHREPVRRHRVVGPHDRRRRGSSRRSGGRLPDGSGSTAPACRDGWEHERRARRRAEVLQPHRHASSGSASRLACRRGRGGRHARSPTPGARRQAAGEGRGSGVSGPTGQTMFRDPGSSPSPVRQGTRAGDFPLGALAPLVRDGLAVPRGAARPARRHGDRPRRPVSPPSVRRGGVGYGRRRSRHGPARRGRSSGPCRR